MCARSHQLLTNDTQVLQIRSVQRSITASLRPLTAHIYHVVIILTGRFSKKYFLLIFSRNSFEQS